ncbi:hypothetical protein GCM10023185_40420 [Hymenobacter saemangeumensis]|uniref:Uncharacterized protein n=2 Tax=Hymenobacter saemangeumensis TaxID=1084522 RepID=A0ABP8IS41_9BACT
MLLSGCRVYERIVHPHRIPNPKPSLEYKDKLKADKERKKGGLKITRKKTKKKAKGSEGEGEASTDDSVPVASATNTESTQESPRTLPDGPTVKYNKKQLIKRNKLLLPKKRHEVAKPSLWQRVKYVFKKKKGKKKKSTPKPPPDVSHPTDPNSIP